MRSAQTAARRRAQRSIKSVSARGDGGAILDFKIAQSFCESKRPRLRDNGVEKRRMRQNGAIPRTKGRAPPETIHPNAIRPTQLT